MRAERPPAQATSTVNLLALAACLSRMPRRVARAVLGGAAQQCWPHLPGGRAGAADRDRDQLTRRSALPRRLAHLDELQSKAHDVNRRLLDTERVGQGCVLASPAFARVALPTLTTHQSLRAQVSGLLGTAYTVHQMSYALARLRVNGLIRRQPHTNTYVLTDDWQRVAIFYTKVHDRLLWPLLAANQLQAQPTLRKALRTIDTHVTHYIRAAILPLKNSRQVSTSLR